LKSKKLPFYYQKSSRNRDIKAGRGGSAATDIEGTANPRKTRGSGLTDPTLAHHLRLHKYVTENNPAQQSWRETHFCSAVLLFLTSRQKLKEMAVAESFFSNEGTEVTSYNSSQPSPFLMLGGRDSYYIF